MTKQLTLEFELERETKNTVRFSEIVKSEFGTTYLGTVYVQKHTLDEMNYKAGDNIKVTIEV